MSDKKYNTTITGLWLTKAENMLSMPLSEKDFANIAAVQQGGKLFIKRNKFKKHDRSPDFYLEAISKEEVERFDNELEGRRREAATTETTSPSEGL